MIPKDSAKADDELDDGVKSDSPKGASSKAANKGKPANGAGKPIAARGKRSPMLMPVLTLAIGLLLGASAMWGLASMGVVQPFRGSQSVTVMPPGNPVPPPTGWDTTFSVRQDVKLIGQYDDSGAAAWDAAKHPLVYLTTNGAGYGGFPSGTGYPGIALIDGETREVVAEMQYSLDGVDPKKMWEDHGVGASSDGKYFYLVTGDSSKPINEAGRVIIISAKTLKVHQVLQTSSYPHHVKAVELYDGTTVKRLVMVETFNWQTGTMRPGSGTYLLDPAQDNKVVGGFRSEDVQANPYNAFPHPSGRYIFVGLPPGPIGDPDIRHNLEGMWAVIDIKTWLPVKFYKGGYDPIWTTFTADGKYAYLTDGGSDEVFKIDNAGQKVMGASRTSVHGAYGAILNWNETRLFTIEKGEASHNRGTLVGEVDPTGMKPVDSYETHCLRGDHGILHPDGAKNEIWISYNSNFQDVVFDTWTRQVKATVSHTGSSHNGAFVKYTVDSNGEWKGELLSDQSGLHGSARTMHENDLGVKEIVYGSLKVSVDVFRQG